MLVGFIIWPTTYNDTFYRKTTLMNANEHKIYIWNTEKNERIHPPHTIVLSRCNEITANWLKTFFIFQIHN